MSRPSPRVASAPAADVVDPGSADPAPFRLKLLGSWELTGEDGRRVQSVLSQPKRLCLLAYLALSAEPVARSIVVALFWPETDEDHARNALSQSLHYLRRSMGKRIVENVEGDRIVVRADYVDFDARTLLAIDGTAPDGTDAGAFDTERWQGDFFEGWNSDSSLPLQDWLDATRLRVRTAQDRLATRQAESIATRESSNPVGDAESRVTDAMERSDAGAIATSETVEGVPTPEDRDALGTRETGADRKEAEAGSDQAGGPPKDATSPGPASIHPLAIAGALLAVVILLTVLLTGGWPGAGGDTPRSAVETGGGPGAGPANAVTAPLAVLMPRLAGTGFVGPESLDAIQIEIVDHLRSVVGPDQQLLSVPFANSPGELQRILQAQSEVPIPRRVIDVFIRMNGSTVLMNARLLSGSGYVVVLGTARETYTLDSEADAIVRLPAEIADLLARDFGGALLGR